MFRSNKQKTNDGEPPVKISRALRRHTRKDPEAATIFNSEKWKDFTTISKQHRIIITNRSRPEDNAYISNFTGLLFEIRDSLSSMAYLLEKSSYLYLIRSSYNRLTLPKNEVDTYAKQIRKSLELMNLTHETSLTPAQADQAYDTLKILNKYYSDIKYRISSKGGRWNFDRGNIQDILKESGVKKYLSTDLAWLIKLSGYQEQAMKFSSSDFKSIKEWQIALYDYYRTPENAYKLEYPRQSFYRSVWGEKNNNKKQGDTPFKNKTLISTYQKLEKIQEYLQDIPHEYTAEEEYVIETLYKTHIPDGINTHMVLQRDAPQELAQFEEDFLEILTQSHKDVSGIVQAHKNKSVRDASNYVRGTKKLLKLKNET